MKKFTALLTLTTLACFQLSAQLIDCDCDNRYQNEIFNNNDIIIETNTTYSTDYNLQMDIYRPSSEVDICTNRPLIILAHGGSFIGGSKSSPTMVDLCETFAKRGYVAASIEYRLATNPTVLGEDFNSGFGYFWMTELEYGIKVIYSAMTDAKAAVRFFRKEFAENSNIYGIDDEQIWMGGNSAGACLGPHMSYISSLEEFISGIDESGQAYAESLAKANGGMEGNSGNEGYSSSISGMINLAGAIHTVSWLDESDTTPIVSCHGTEDETVPDECGTILNNANNLTACGSMAMQPILSDYGVSNDLLIYEGEAHCPWDFNPSYKAEMIDFVTAFVYNNIEIQPNLNSPCNPISIHESKNNKELLYKTDILGRTHKNQNKTGFIISVYTDGTVNKEYLKK